MMAFIALKSDMKNTLHEPLCIMFKTSHSSSVGVLKRKLSHYKFSWLFIYLIFILDVNETENLKITSRHSEIKINEFFEPKTPNKHLV